MKDIKDFLLDWGGWIWSNVVSGLDVYWQFELKDKLTIAGIVVTFLFSCLNFMRTSQALRGTKANNRASRFEVVHGPTLNEAVKEINETCREISIGVIGFTDLASAQTFFREKIRPRLRKAEHIVVNEIERIAISDLAKDQQAWKQVSKSERWDEVNANASTFLAATQLDVTIAQFELLKKSLGEITTAIEKVRSAENNI
ncbi:hypothetical protein ACK83U_00720 [Rhizobium sp. WW22]|uniref:hypothetical protein n=1 Tax=Rhizobium sp. WW22 TaxID=3389070 RepID=UPI00399998F8